MCPQNYKVMCPQNYLCVPRITKFRIIRATIIKDPDKARALSHRKYNFMRNLQLENYDEEDPNMPVLAPYQ